MHFLGSSGDTDEFVLFSCTSSKHVTHNIWSSPSLKAKEIMIIDVALLKLLTSVRYSSPFFWRNYLLTINDVIWGTKESHKCVDITKRKALIFSESSTCCRIHCSKVALASAFGTKKFIGKYKKIGRNIKRILLSGVYPILLKQQTCNPELAALKALRHFVLAFHLFFVETEYIGLCQELSLFSQFKKSLRIHNKQVLNCWD